MTPSDWNIRDAAPGDEHAVQQVVFTTLREYGLTPNIDGTDADLKDLHEFYVRRGGVFRIVTDAHGNIVGCGGLLPMENDDVELRKMYLTPAVRGKGLGRRLLEDLLAMARSRGHRRVVLDTASVLKEAIALYRSRGFQPYDNPDRVQRCDQSMFLKLTA
ncbi:MAG: GNAT family N-acetyltransferase [Gammaproteobacteria bacterium]|nr:GNAT family N-acetyltransferase [Gammaproteobacteria bacterium]